jgi:signal transduction histidine kinase
MPSRTLSFRRTLLSAALVAVAVLVPTVAWFVSGSREAARQASSLRQAALDEVADGVQTDADRLATRLETLVIREAGRPFYHYQSLFHDPRGAAQGLAVTRSPLAVGASDPLVLAHFQIDEAGNVSLPTVNERFPELSTDEGFSDFCAVLADLQNGLVVDETVARKSASPGDDGAEELVLERDAWEQIHLAEAVYATLTSDRATSRQSPSTITPGDVDNVTVRVGQLHWVTIVLDSGPSLAALREVTTPDGLRLQGFTLATEAVAEWLGDRRTFVPVAPVEENTISTPVSDTGWYLTSDAGPALRDAKEVGDVVRRQFRNIFAFSSAAALCAALAVVMIVAQTDRLARQRARFAAAAAHELKTPLATLRLHSEMLAEGLGRPDQFQDYAHRIVPEVRRLGRVVSNMLDLARLERGASLAHPSEGDLAQATTDCVDRVRPTLEQAGLEVELSVAPGIPRARFDRDAVCQILDNLLDNAEKHTRSVRDRTARVTIDSEGDSLRVTVSDNGPGIPRRAQRDLFRPFARHTDGVAGLGLGLAVARSLARAQDGDLEVADVTEGATFVLTLPAAPGESAQAPKALAEGLVASRARR